MTITTASDRLEVIHDPAAEDQPRISAPIPGHSGDLVAAAAEVQASSRPTFTITDAATACSVSRKTITRKLPELAGHGAAKDDDGVWRIPVEALLAVGLHPGRSLPELASAAARPLAPTPALVRPVEQDTVTIARDRWDDVRIRLARAEAEAAERGLALADARLALRALTAGPASPVRVAERTVGPSTGRDAAELIPPAFAVAAPAAPISAAAPAQNVADLAPDTTPDQALAATPMAPGSSTAEAGLPALTEGTDPLPADVVAARNLAARTGGYVPAGTAPAKKRRWWQSH